MYFACNPSVRITFDMPRVTESPGIPKRQNPPSDNGVSGGDRVFGDTGGNGSWVITYSV